MDNEEWRDIVGYEKLYMVSNYGRVKSLEKTFLLNKGKQIQHRPERILKQSKNKWGYMKVWLYKGDKRKEYFVHRLVAQAFLENQNNKPCVNHIDYNKTNNKIDNLEWCTYQENSDWSVNNGRHEMTEEWRNKILSTRKCKPVIGTDQNGKEYYFDKVRSVVQMGFDAGDVIKCCKGRKMSIRGFTWRYADGGLE